MTFFFLPALLLICKRRRVFYRPDNLLTEACTLNLVSVHSCGTKDLGSPRGPSAVSERVELSRPRQPAGGCAQSPSSLRRRAFMSTAPLSKKTFGKLAFSPCSENPRCTSQLPSRQCRGVTSLWTPLPSASGCGTFFLNDLHLSLQPHGSAIEIHVYIYVFLLFKRAPTIALFLN